MFCGNITIVQVNASREFKFKMKIMYPDTFHRLVEDFNLTIQDCWGSYDMEPFNEHSSQQIYQIAL